MMSRMDRDQALQRLETIVDGIDVTELDGGWWETTTGADFGAQRLAQLRALIEDLAAPACD